MTRTQPRCQPAACVAIILMCTRGEWGNVFAAAESTVPVTIEASLMRSSPPASPISDPVDACSSIDQSNYYTCIDTKEIPSASPSAVPSGMLYCPGHEFINDDYIIYKNMGGCYYDNTNVRGNFVAPHDLQPGQLSPLIWRGTGKIVSSYLFQVGLPSQLTESLLEYATQLGIVDIFRELTSTSPISPQGGKFFTSSTYSKSAVVDNHNSNINNNEQLLWYAQRPHSKWDSDMHWIAPANEITHESFLKVLVDGQFGEFSHRDITDSDGVAYNVIMPLLLEDEYDTPELIVRDDANPVPEYCKRGGYEYQLGVGVMLGDDVMHSTHECDYRNMTNAKHGGWVEESNDEVDGDHDEEMSSSSGGGGRRRQIGMRLAASVFIGETNEENANVIAEQSPFQLFPLRNGTWLLAQAGRHWQAPVVGKDGVEHNSRHALARDEGRKSFYPGDEWNDCKQRAIEGLCETDVWETRRKCPLSCKIYVEDGNNE